MLESVHDDQKTMFDFAAYSERMIVDRLISTKLDYVQPFSTSMSRSGWKHVRNLNDKDWGLCKKLYWNTITTEQSSRSIDNVRTSITNLNKLETVLTAATWPAPQRRIWKFNLSHMTSYATMAMQRFVQALYIH
jgi:hypothetical protein